MKESANVTFFQFYLSFNITRRRYESRTRQPVRKEADKPNGDLNKSRNKPRIGPVPKWNNTMPMTMAMSVWSKILGERIAATNIGDRAFLKNTYRRGNSLSYARGISRSHRLPYFYVNNCTAAQQLEATRESEMPIVKMFNTTKAPSAISRYQSTFKECAHIVISSTYFPFESP